MSTGSGGIIDSVTVLVDIGSIGMITGLFSSLLSSIKISGTVSAGIMMTGVELACSIISVFIGTVVVVVAVVFVFVQ